MILAPVTSRQIPISAASIVAEDKHLLVYAEGMRLPLSRRARNNMVSMTGLTPKRLIELAGAGGIDMGDQMRGSSTSLLTCSVQGDTIVAVSGRTPNPIDSDGVIERLKQDGFVIPGSEVCDGRFSAIRLAPKQILIGNEAYRSGISVDVDLAGQDLPKIRFYVERQICKNGQSIEVIQQERLVPQYAASGRVNADTLSQHISSWSGQGFPERIINRLHVATETPASFAEAISLQKIAKSRDIDGMRKSLDKGQNDSYADHPLEQMFGDYRTRFGIASLTEIPGRELQFLKTETSVAGLINLATEMATYYVSRDGGNAKLTNWWNRLIAHRYDFEDLENRTIALPDRWMPSVINVASVN